MFRRNADAAEQRRAKQAIVDIFTPNNARYLETRTQRNLIAKVKEGLVLRRQQQQPVIRNIYVVGAGTFLGASGQRGPPPMNLSAARTANINRLIVALDMANWIDDAQVRDRIDLQRLWVKTVEPGPEQPERSFWLADNLMLSQTTGLSPKFAAVDHTASIYRGAFVYNVGVNLQWLRVILSSQPAAVLGPVISPNMWQDQAGQNEATQFLQNYTLIPLRPTPTDVMNVENVGVTYWPPGSPLPQTALYISVRPANQATPAPQMPGAPGMPQAGPASQGPAAPPMAPGASQTPSPAPPDYATTETGRIEGPPAPRGWNSIHPLPPVYHAAVLGNRNQRGRRIQPQEAEYELSMEQYDIRQHATRLNHRESVRRANPGMTEEGIAELANATLPQLEEWVPPPRRPRPPPRPSQLPPPFNDLGEHNWNLPRGMYDESLLDDQGDLAQDLNPDHSVMPFHEVQSSGSQPVQSQPVQSQPVQSQPEPSRLRRIARRFAPRALGGDGSSRRTQRRFNPLPPDNGEGPSRPRQPPPGPPPPPPAV